MEKHRNFVFENKEKNRKKTKIIFDYKNPLALYSFIEGGKIIPARNTGLTSKQQRALRSAVKKARNLGLLPTHYQSYDNFGRPEMISTKTFSCK